MIVRALTVVDSELSCKIDLLSTIRYISRRSQRLVERAFHYD